MPRKVFTAGEILTAADVNTNLMDQSVMVFAGTAARGSAIPSPTEGMVTYLEDSDAVQVYTTDWEDVGVAPAILQVLSAVKTNSFSTTSSSHTTVTGLSQAITPSSTSSKVLVSGTLHFHCATNAGIEVVVRRDGTEIFSGTAGGAANGVFSANIATILGTNLPAVTSFQFLDSPATTSSTTYEIAVSVTASQTLYVNVTSSANYGQSSSITVMEVAG